jgi:hypothetical protein
MSGSGPGLSGAGFTRFLWMEYLLRETEPGNKAQLPQKFQFCERLTIDNTWNYLQTHQEFQYLQSFSRRMFLLIT